jgi:hypothetical protein
MSMLESTANRLGVALEEIISYQQSSMMVAMGGGERAAPPPMASQAIHDGKLRVIE